MPSIGARRSACPATAPNLSLDFTSGTLDPRFTFTRASTAWAYDATGTLQSYGTNVPRFDYGPSPAGVTNWIRNNSMIGAVAPSTLPTNWAGAAINGGTGTSQLSLVQVNGFPAIEFVLGGTPSLTTSIIQFDATAQIQAYPSQTWTGSFNFQLNSGSLTTGFTAFQITLREYDSSSVLITQTATSIASATSTMTRYSVTATLSATTAFVVLALRVGTDGTAVACDFTLSAPQLEIGASAGTIVMTTNAAANAGAIPIGLLIEEPRTNSIRNNSGTGGVVGSTLPTNWTTTPLGLTTSVVSIGTEYGIPYVDIRYSGTTTSAGQINAAFEGAVTAVAAQNWTGSIFLRLVAGDWTNVTLTGVQVNVVGGTGQLRTVATITSAALPTQRYSTAVTTGTGTTSVDCYFVGTVSTGVAVDFTIRLGAACLDLGAFLTSPIITTNATVARAAENPTMPLNTMWFNPSGHSALCVTTQPVLIPAAAMPYQFDDGVLARDMCFYSVGAGSIFTSTGLNAALAGVVAINTPVKTAGAFGLSRQGGSLNAGTVTVGAFAATTGLTVLRLGSHINVTQRYSGYLISLFVWDRVLADSELKAFTRP